MGGPHHSGTHGRTWEKTLSRWSWEKIFQLRDPDECCRYPLLAGHDITEILSRARPLLRIRKKICRHLFFFFFANLRCQQIVFGSGHCCAHLGKPEMSETFSFYHGGLKVKMVRARANTKENTGKGDRNARGKGSQN